MRRELAWAIAPLVFAPLSAARGEPAPFTGELQIRASVGTDPGTFQLLSTSISGNADVSGAVVKIPAGILSVAVPSLSGFGGTFVNGPVTFSAGGAGPGPGVTCGLNFQEEICIDGGGFGGVMPLSGVTQAGQGLSVWGSGGTSVASTTSGALREVEGTPWTTGMASVWFYVPEIDPTPFRIDATGTFRGLPGTFTGTGPPGLSLVTPMMIRNVGSTSSTNEVRAIARLRLDFEEPATPVPAGGTGAAIILTILLFVIGCLRLQGTAAG